MTESHWQVNPNVLLFELGLAESILKVDGTGAPIEHEHQHQEKSDCTPGDDRSMSVELSLLMLPLDAESSFKFSNVAIRGMLTLEQPKTWQNICRGLGLRNFDPSVLAFEFCNLLLHGKDPFVHGRDHSWLVCTSGDPDQRTWHCAKMEPEYHCHETVMETLLEHQNDNEPCQFRPIQ